MITHSIWWKKIDYTALHRKLEQLKKMFNIEDNIKLVVLDSKEQTDSHGFIEGDTIHIYENNEKTVLETLCHEFIHYINRAERNMMIKTLNSHTEHIEFLIKQNLKLNLELYDSKLEDTSEQLGKGLAKVLNKSRR